MWYKRLTRVNPWQNCVIMLKISHFCVKNTQGKVFEGLHIVNGRKIVGILIIPKVTYVILSVIFLNRGKLGQLENNSGDIKGLSYSLLTFNNLYALKVSGCRSFTKHNAPSNVGDRFEGSYILPILTSPRGCRIKTNLNKPLIKRGFHTKTPKRVGIKPSPYIKLLFKENLSSL